MQFKNYKILKVFGHNRPRSEKYNEYGFLIMNVKMIITTTSTGAKIAILKECK